MAYAQEDSGTVKRDFALTRDGNAYILRQTLYNDDVWFKSPGLSLTPFDHGIIIRKGKVVSDAAESEVYKRGNDREGT